MCVMPLTLTILCWFGWEGIDGELLGFTASFLTYFILTGNHDTNDNFFTIGLQFHTH